MKTRHLVGALLILVLDTGTILADIYQWEYIDPARPELGKKESTTLCPDGAGVSAGPGSSLAYRDLTKAYLTGVDLRGSSFFGAILADADLANAVVKETSFDSTTSGGFTAAQLYSTASYASGDLVGIRLKYNDLAGWDFAGKDLTGAYFSHSKLAGADFANAVVKGVEFTDVTGGGFTAAQLYSTASYASGDLAGIRLNYNDMTGWDFAGKDLTGAMLSYSTLTSADLSHADLHWAGLEDSILTNANLTNANMSNAMFSYGTMMNGANLTNVTMNAVLFNGTLAGANLTNADLRGVRFYGATLTDANFDGAVLDVADFSFADLRGATGLTSQQWLSTRDPESVIFPDGTIDGLSLQKNSPLVVRNHSIAIIVTGFMEMAQDSNLEILFDESEWRSTISFEEGIPMTLGGTLRLMPDLYVPGESLLGRTFDLFDWDSVLDESNRFDEIVSWRGYVWDTSDLYTTGEVTLMAVPEPGTLALLALGCFSVLGERCCRLS